MFSADEEIKENREAARNEMAAYLVKCMADDECAARPTPWTSGVTYYDGLGWQFFDANGQPIMQEPIRNAEDVATILRTINR